MALCACGCGQGTKRSKRTGRFTRYLRGHTGRVYEKTGPRNPDDDFTDRYEIDPDTGCWIWTRYINPRGYGRLVRGGEQLAHRVLYRFHRGEIPDGLDLDHLCRNRACVNPDHLEPVTIRENNRRGALTKLTAEKVRQIRDLCSQGWLQTDIAAAYGVTPQAIYRVKTRQCWKDV
jgi:hypothetical protein